MSASCKVCLGKECWRKCKATVVDSVEAAETLKGCQVVDGFLDIQMKTTLGVNIEKVLKESLSEIVEIEDYLKISRSFPIVTLKFLKNLNLIKGTQLENNKYSIVIWDNENLENLFEDGQKLEVKNGKLFIHFNPRLCFDKVDKLANLTSREIENLENAQFSNGDKISCNMTKVETEVVEVMENSVGIKWNTLKAEKTVLEYVVYYIKAEYKDIDMWTSRDTCGNDG